MTKFGYKQTPEHIAKRKVCGPRNPMWKGTLEYLKRSIANHKSDDCLLWPFSKSYRDYGGVWYEGRSVPVHRLAFFFTHGHWPTPNGLHTCDNPPCFNPRHIIEGTQADNLADMRRKGRDRTLRGEQRPSSKTDNATVLKIRAEYIPRKVTAKYLAEKYNLALRNVVGILGRQTWKHI
jgi:hypothetical protein